MSIPVHPPGLGPDGRALWTAILTRYWMDDEAHKLSTLANACKVSDRIAELEAGMAGQPLTVLVGPTTHHPPPHRGDSRTAGP